MLTMSISIPSDNEGFIPLQCPLCNGYFKLTASDLNSDDILEIWCPYCGIKSLDGYITSDVTDLALVMSKNEVLKHIQKELSKTFKGINGHNIKTTVQKPKLYYESRILVKFDALECIDYQCCNKSAKITAISKFVGDYCPFCGVSIDGN